MKIDDADPSQNLTKLLLAWNDGNQEALNQVMSAVYLELRRLAASYLRKERPNHTLQPTALVHEAFLRLINQKQVQWQNRAHFFGIAAQEMRRILVDHARKHHAAKRGGAGFTLTLDDFLGQTAAPSVDLMALDDALNTLATFDPQQSRIIELRFFGGLSVAETAVVLGISPATIGREWSIAKAWLHKELNLGRKVSGRHKKDEE